MATSAHLRQYPVYLIAIGLSLATLLLPAPPDYGSSLFHMAMIAETIPAVLSVGAGIYFLLGLHQFKLELRQVYRLVALSMVVYAIGLIQLPILEMTGLIDQWYVTSGAINIMYVLGAFLLYLSVIRYGSLLQVHHRVFSPVYALVVLVLAAALSPLFPHSGNFYHNQMDLFVNVGLTAVSATFFSFATSGLLHIKRAAGPAYTNALAWSFVGAAAISVFTIATEFFELNGFTGFIINSGLYFLPLIIAVMSNLKAAVSFNRISQF